MTPLDLSYEEGIKFGRFVHARLDDRDIFRPDLSDAFVYHMCLGIWKLDCHHPPPPMPLHEWIMREESKKGCWICGTKFVLIKEVV